MEWWSDGGMEETVLWRCLGMRGTDAIGDRRIGVNRERRSKRIEMSETGEFWRPDIYFRHGRCSVRVRK